MVAVNEAGVETGFSGGEEVEEKEREVRLRKAFSKLEVEDFLSAFAGLSGGSMSTVDRRNGSDGGDACGDGKHCGRSEGPN